MAGSRLRLGPEAGAGARAGAVQKVSWARLGWGF